MLLRRKEAVISSIILFVLCSLFLPSCSNVTARAATPGRELAGGELRVSAMDLIANAGRYSGKRIILTEAGRIGPEESAIYTTPWHAERIISPASIVLFSMDETIAKRLMGERINQVVVITVTGIFHADGSSYKRAGRGGIEVTTLHVE